MSRDEYKRSHDLPPVLQRLREVETADERYSTSEFRKVMIAVTGHKPFWRNLDFWIGLVVALAAIALGILALEGVWRQWL